MFRILKRHIKISILLLLLLGGASGLLAWLWVENQEQKKEQETIAEQLYQAKEAQKEAVTTRRISTQLEEIAYQQKDISDAQKQEAIHQTSIADRMREHAELEREKAFQAQQAALEAFDQMQEQKRLAELRREEAVQARLKADTLARLALGRSLGSQASTQHATGSKDLANLLSYSAWKFTSENQGDIYQPAIFNALSQVSSLSKRWTLHKGAIRDLSLFKFEGQSYLLSASQYGELLLSKVSPDNIYQQKRLIDNPAFDFRRVLVNTNGKQIIALSYTSVIIVIDLKEPNKQQEIKIDLKDPVGMALVNNQLYVASKNGEVQIANVNNWIFAPFYQHPTPITCFELGNHGIMLGDEKGGAYTLGEKGDAQLLWKTIQQPVTDILSNQNHETLATGYKNGTVLIRNNNIDQQRELRGHISPITQIISTKKLLLTGSHDGTIRLWDIYDTQKIISSVVYESTEWIHIFVIDDSGERLFVGDEKGNLNMVSISPDQMAAQIKKQLTRNFTQEEWLYYINEVSEYETYK